MVSSRMVLGLAATRRSIWSKTRSLFLFFCFFFWGGGGRERKREVREREREGRRSCCCLGEDDRGVRSLSRFPRSSLFCVPPLFRSFSALSPHQLSLTASCRPCSPAWRAGPPQPLRRQREPQARSTTTTMRAAPRSTTTMMPAAARSRPATRVASRRRRRRG
jgi:hypothetical protein